MPTRSTRTAISNTVVKDTQPVQFKGRQPLATADGSGGLLFDRRPIQVEGFLFRGRSVEPVGKPTAKQLQNALALAAEFTESSQYWVGGLMAYAESREDWKEKLSQIQSVTGLAHQTLINLGYIYRHTTDRTRTIATSPAHAGTVAKLAEDDQVKWLTKAREEGLGVRDLRMAIRADNRRMIIEGRATLEGLFRVVTMDFPWKYDDRPPSGVGAQDHYPGMTVEEGLKIPLAAHVMKDAAIGFWVTAPFLFNCEGDSEIPDALRLLRQWEFKPKTQIIWDKGEHHYGHYVSVQHEIFVIAIRGSCTPDRLTPMLPSVYREKPEPVHSRKPVWFRKSMERLWDGPYLEMFGRELVEGWTVYGNQIGAAVETAGTL